MKFTQFQEQISVFLIYFHSKTRTTILGLRISSINYLITAKNTITQQKNQFSCQILVLHLQESN